MDKPNNLTITAVIGGEPLKLLLPGEWTVGESRLVKHEIGMSVVDVEQGLGKSDPDAWTAVLRISAARVGRVLTDADIDATPILALAEAVVDAAEKAGGGRPPAKRKSGSGDATTPAAAAAAS